MLKKTANRRSIFCYLELLAFQKKENKNEYQDCFSKSYNYKTITIYFFVNRPKHYRFGGLA